MSMSVSTRRLRTRHRFHGDEQRFAVVADFVGERFGGRVATAADVAGGQGMLARLLQKRHGIVCDVIDPRGWTLKGVRGRPETYVAEMADYYDLVVGLHADEAIREVARSALVRPVVLVPCCNFWDRSVKLGRAALLDAIQAYYQEHGVAFDVFELPFRGPYNVALVSEPSANAGELT
jgi:hypothetical protein